MYAKPGVSSRGQQRVGGRGHSRMGPWEGRLVPQSTSAQYNPVAQAKTLAWATPLSFTASIQSLCKSCELHLHGPREPNLSPSPGLAASHRGPITSHLDPSNSLLAGPLTPLPPLQSTLQTAARGI